MATSTSTICVWLDTFWPNKVVHGYFHVGFDILLLGMTTRSGETRWWIHCRVDIFTLGSRRCTSARQVRIGIDTFTLGSLLEEAPGATLSPGFPLIYRLPSNPPNCVEHRLHITRKREGAHEVMSCHPSRGRWVSA